MQVLLSEQQQEASSRPTPATETADERPEVVDEEQGTMDDDQGSDSTEGPLCLICLDEYEKQEDVFESGTCSHKYHKACILDWLQRHATTECPCCRTPMVSEEDVWRVVGRLREEKRQELRRERGWFWSRRRQAKERADQASPAEGETERSESADDDLVTSPTDTSNVTEETDTSNVTEEGPSHSDTRV